MTSPFFLCRIPSHNIRDSFDGGDRRFHGAQYVAK